MPVQRSPFGALQIRENGRSFVQNCRFSLGKHIAGLHAGKARKIAERDTKIMPQTPSRDHGSGPRAKANERLFLRQPRRVAKEIPAQLLPTAAAEGLMRAFNAVLAAWADGKNRARGGGIGRRMPAVVFDLHGDAVGEFFVRGSISKQVVWRFLKSDAELFQRIDRRDRFFAGDRSEIP